MRWKELFLSFEGRIGRKTFWLKGTLPLMVMSLFLAGLDFALGFGGYLSAAWQLLTIWPILAISAKRWHDRDKSAWWILIGLVPLIGQIWSFVEAGCLKGTDGPNRFGADPLTAAQPQI